MTLQPYRICTYCVMDTTAQDIEFNREGQCNYCREFLARRREALLSPAARERDLRELAARILAVGRHKAYDCVLGVSGGLDSSYALYVAKRNGLRPLAVHLDNGWNSESAVSNIENLCGKLEVDLFTCVINWEEFRELQLAFFKAGVVDIELLTDQAIGALLYQLARRNKLEHIIAGTNLTNEGFRLPPHWAHYKADLRNIRSIHARFGSGKSLKTYPQMGTLARLVCRYLSGIQWISILDYADFERDEAAAVLQREADWKPFGNKHYESVFTRFYQGYILPIKFHVDKRRVYLSNLICSGQLRREDAIEQLLNSPYADARLLAQDREFVIRKLGFSEEEFAEYLRAPSRSHAVFGSEAGLFAALSKMHRVLVKISARIPKMTSGWY